MKKKDSFFSVQKNSLQNFLLLFSSFCLEKTFQTVIQVVHNQVKELRSKDTKLC